MARRHRDLSVFTDLYALSNHFSSTPDARVGQRTEQAAYNAAIVAALQEADPAARVITAGDFNVFPRPDDPFATGQEWACSPLPCEVGPSDQLGTDVRRRAAQPVGHPRRGGPAERVQLQLRGHGPNARHAVGHRRAVRRPGPGPGRPLQCRLRRRLRRRRGAGCLGPRPADRALVHRRRPSPALHALVDYYVGTGALPADKAFLFHNRLDKAQALAAQGKTGTASHSCRHSATRRTTMHRPPWPMRWPRRQPAWRASSDRHRPSTARRPGQLAGPRVAPGHGFSVFPDRFCHVPPLPCRQAQERRGRQ